MQQKIRILLADDHPLLREGIAALLNRQPDFEVVGQAGTGRITVDLWRQLRPTIGLIDLDMPDGDGAEAVSVIREFDPGAKLVIVTTYFGEEDIYRCISSGAKGYLLKGETPEVLAACIRTVVAGGRYIPASIAEKLADRLPAQNLSDREMDVLRLVAEGQSNADIADQLGITEGTVKFHVNHLLSKLGVKDRTQAVIAAAKRGLIRLPSART